MPRATSSRGSCRKLSRARNLVSRGGDPIGLVVAGRRLIAWPAMSFSCERCPTIESAGSSRGGSGDARAQGGKPGGVAGGGRDGRETLGRRGEQGGGDEEEEEEASP